MLNKKNNPFAVDVHDGDTKAFCSCGLSATMPFCNGSHQSTNKTPYLISFDESKNNLCLWMPRLIKQALL